MREVVVSGFKSLRTVNLTSKTKNVAIGRKCSEDAELEALLDKDSCQTQKRTYIRSNSTNNFIAFEIIGNDSKQGNWIPYELKPRNVERRFFTCEMLLARHKGFLHRIVTGDEKWIHYDNLKKRKS